MLEECSRQPPVLKVGFAVGEALKNLRLLFKKSVFFNIANKHPKRTIHETYVVIRSLVKKNFLIDASPLK